MSVVTFALTTTLSFIFSTAEATLLSPPFDITSSQTLPAGVRNARFVTMFLNSDQKLGNAGESLPLADPLFKKITFGDVIFGKKDFKDKGAIQEVLDSLGESEESLLAESTGQVNLSANVFVPIIAYAPKERWTLAVAVPVMNYSLNMDAGVRQGDPARLENFAKALEEKGLSQKASEFRTKMTAPVQYKLEEYGYRALEKREGSKLGDIRLVSKHLLIDNEQQKLAVQPEVTFPTGKQADINAVDDLSFGEKQWDLTAGLLYDIAPIPELVISQYIAHTWQLPDTRARRIWERYDSSLSPDIDQQTKRNLGDISTYRLGLLGQKWGGRLGLGYSWQYKDRDRFSGSTYASERYAWMSNKTRQRLQSMQMLVGFETISLFKQKKFPVPLMINLSHNVVVEGKNVNKDATTVLDIGLFF